MDMLLFINVMHAELQVWSLGLSFAVSAPGLVKLSICNVKLQPPLDSSSAPGSIQMGDSRTPVFTRGLNDIGCLTYHVIVHLLRYTLACVSPGMLHLPYTY